MTKPDKDTLLETYKVVISEEQFFNSLFENRLSFYTGLLTTVVTAIVLGFFYSTEIIHYIVLLFGPMILILISITGIKAGHRALDRLSRILTVRAKIEQALGLTVAHKFSKESPEQYWGIEPIIDTDHLASRLEYKTSSEFSKFIRRRSQSYLSSTVIFYRFFIFTGIILEGIILFLVVSHL